MLLGGDYWIPETIIKRNGLMPLEASKATDKVGPGSADLRQPVEALYFQRVYWVIEELVWARNV